MQRVCELLHDEKLLKQPVIVFCVNPGCLNRFACSLCVNEQHNNHQNDLIPIENLESHAKDLISQIRQSEKYILIDELNGRRIALIKEIEFQYNVFPKSLPQISEIITEKQLNLLHKYLNWQVNLDEIKAMTENLMRMTLALQSGLQITRIHLLLDDFESEEMNYSGEVVNNIQFGSGVAKYLDGSTYNGDWVDGLKHGMGKFENNGGSYNGQWQNDTPHGYGQQVWPDGRKYEGSFKDGSMHGYGTFKWTNGNVYTGLWIEGKRNGHGVLEFGGDVYEGSWKDDKQNGFGAYSNQNGNRYIGQFKENHFNGYGQFRYPDGRIYEGDFKDDAFNGKGKFNWPDGALYVGDFANGELSGVGKLFDETGYLYTGTWNDSKKQGDHILHKLVKIEQLSFKDDRVLKRKKL